MKINLNDSIKFKLTDLGKDIYYHRFDELIEKKPEVGLIRHMPNVDEDGYTTMQLWYFMELYGPHIGMCKPNVIDPIEIITLDDE